MSGPSKLTDDPFLLSLMGDFLDESQGLLQQLNNQLLHLEELVEAAAGEPVAADQDFLNDMFRAAHSLKGLTGMLRLEHMNGLTHKIENVFEAARHGRLPIGGKMVDVVYQAVGRLEAMIELIGNAAGDEIDCHAEIAQIEALLHESGALHHDGAAPSPHAVSPTPAAQPAQHRHQPEPTPAPAEPVPTAPAAATETFLANVSDDDEIPAKYLGIFVDECELTVEELQAQLLAGPDKKANEAMLVGCHRIKGSAASIGLNRIARLAHFMEDLLQEHCQERKALPADLVEALLKCVDAVRGFVAGMKAGNRIDTLDEACRQLLAAARISNTRPPAASAAPRQTENQQELLQKILAHAPDQITGFAGHVAFEPGLALVELKAQIVLDRLHRFGSLFECHPGENQLESIAQTNGLSFGIETDSQQQPLIAALQVEGVASVVLEPLRPQGQPSGSPPPESSPQRATADSAASAAEPAPAGEPGRAVDNRPAQSGKAKGKPPETLRVDIDRLDQLMNLAGQLVINKARFSQIGSRIRSVSASKTALAAIASTTATPRG